MVETKEKEIENVEPEVIATNRVQLPPWFAEDLIIPFRAGITHTFLLHGDINGLVKNPSLDDESDRAYIPLRKFLDSILDQRPMVMFYNIASGIRFLNTDMEKEFRRVAGLDGEEDAPKDPVAAAKAGLAAKRPIPREPDVCLPLIEKVLKSMEGVALVVQSIHFLAPISGGGATLPPNERATIERFKNWSQDEELRANNTIILLITDQAAKVSSELKGSGSEIQTIFIPKPNKDERKAFIQSLTERGEGFREADSQLKKLQRKLKRTKSSAPQHEEIQEEISELEDEMSRFSPPFSVPEDFDIDVFANVTQGMGLRQILEIFLHSKKTDKPISLEYVKAKKVEILNDEYGDVMEVVEPAKGLEDIGGLEHIKEYFRSVIDAIRRGEIRLVPMGVSLYGPPGTGKTAIVEALAKEAGFNFVKIKNAKNMYVGESEARKEKQIYGLRSIAPVIVMNDEADLAEADRNSPKGDSGVSDYLMKMWMEFLSDPKIRGQVIVISCSNRPDRIDPALKRSGRSDERLLLPMPSTVERTAIFEVGFRYHKIPTTVTNFSEFSSMTDGLSGADIIEKIIPTSFRFAVYEGKNEVDSDALKAAIDDTIPSASQSEIDMMTLLGLRECSSRSLLPPNIKEIVMGIKSRNLAENIQNILDEIKARRIVDIE